MPIAPSVFMVFIAGMATVITPCVLPILPAVLSGSVGSRLRPLAIVTGMSVTFTLMGVFILAVASFTFFADYLRWFSIFFVIGMGGILFDELYEKRKSLAVKMCLTGIIILLTSLIIEFTIIKYILLIYLNSYINLLVKNASEFLGNGFILASFIIFVYNELNRIYAKMPSSILIFEKYHMPFFEKMYSITLSEGLLWGFFLGISIGILWIPSVGPTLGSVFAYTASSTTAGNLLLGTALLLVYSLGFGIPVLIIVYAGKIVSNKIPWFLERGYRIKKISGLILIFVGLILVYGIDRYFETILLPYFPVYI